ncbi:MAG: hypothetical protein ACUVUG_08565 [Candidatus Aminicenantia bacterium]
MCSFIFKSSLKGIVRNIPRIAPMKFPIPEYKNKVKNKVKREEFGKRNIKAGTVKITPFIGASPEPSILWTIGVSRVKPPLKMFFRKGYSKNYRWDCCCDSHSNFKARIHVPSAKKSEQMKDQM